MAGKNKKIKIDQYIIDAHFENYIHLLSNSIRYNEACAIAGQLALSDHYEFSTRTKWYKLKKAQLEFIRTYLTKKQNFRITEIMLQLEWEGPIKTIKKANLKAKKNGSRY